MEKNECADGPGPLRVPSRPEKEPWNTVGLPEPFSAVRRAVREIETRLQEDRRVEPHEEAHRRMEEEGPNADEVARTRLLWQAREKFSERPKTSVEYRTDYFPDREATGENVIILKLEEIPTIQKKDVTVQTINTETIETLHIESHFNYERSWQDFRDFIWSSKSGPGRIGTIDSDRVSSVKSHIPRVRKERVCGKCPKAVQGDKGYCEAHDPSINYQKFTAMDPQRSRTNFFGNSNSYALRCNLFAVSQNQFANSNRRKFYMTPEAKKAETFNKIYATSGYETFQAKKRVFPRQKPGRSVNGVHSTDMW